MNGWHASIILDVLGCLLACVLGMEWNSHGGFVFTLPHFTSPHFARSALLGWLMCCCSTWLCVKSVAVPAWPVMPCFFFFFLGQAGKVPLTPPFRHDVLLIDF